jgi:hypothetical protein
MNAFKRLLDYAAQVEELSIQNLVDASLSERNILKTFHNSLFIIVERGMSSPAYSFCHIKKYNSVVHYKSKLQYLSDKKHCILTY